MLNIIIPLAGPSDLFSNSGYFYPKSLVEIHNRPMIDVVLEGPKKILRDHKFIFIIKDEDATKFHLDSTLNLIVPNCTVIKIKKITSGALCSILMAIDYINDTDNILILNGDQVLNLDYDYINQNWVNQKSDVGIVVFESIHPRWSYAKFKNDIVIQTAEKNPISNNAIAGYYYFKSAKDFFDCAFESIKNDVQLDGHFYVAPVINQYILKNKRVNYYEISTDKYHSFYSPQRLNDYENNKKNYPNVEENI